jgi:hypothetical protein
MLKRRPLEGLSSTQSTTTEDGLSVSLAPGSEPVSAHAEPIKSKEKPKPNANRLFIADPSDR